MKNLFRFIALLVAWNIQVSLHAQVPVMSSYPSARAVIFLDFDGHTVQGTSWNYAGPIVCGASGLTTAKIIEVFNRVAEDYRPFNINITTDSTLYWSAPVMQRTRVIVTISSSWYGTAGGVAFTGSFTWGDNTPAFVFSALHGYRVKDIAEATSHEAGHTLGLSHQSKYDADCYKVSEYNSGQGTGEIGWAPIMGVGYSKNFTLWNYGPNTFGCTNIQSDLDIITSAGNGFGYRVDDHGTDFSTATIPVFAANEFEMEGIIERNTDKDFFRFIMPGAGRFELNATPYNVGTGNAGSDLDLQVSLYDGAQQLLSIYNPGTLLNSVADTNLNAGTYYLKVEGKGNQYAPAYASLGSYSLLGRIEVGGGEILPLRKFQLRGSKNGDKHQLDWTFEADEPVKAQVIERSVDGRRFEELAETGAEIRNYIYRPQETGNPIFYRLRADLADGRRYYSNTVNIREYETGERPRLITNPATAGAVQVSSPAAFTYRIMDLNGRIISRGQLGQGSHTINSSQLIHGLYMIQFTVNDQQWTDKLLIR